jgi:Winged helix DNA-binding domain
MTPRRIALERLARQGIGSPSDDSSGSARSPGAVVTALGAVQGQDYLGSLWSVGLRCPGAAEGDVEQALADRSIVRTWLLRGTLHLLAPADLRWLLALLAPRSLAGNAGRHRQLELDDALFARSEKLAVQALQGGRRLTRDAFYELLEGAGIATAGQRGYHITWRLAQLGVLCFGPREGSQPTFVLLEEWVPPAPVLDREEALAELARRYFTSHGPATLADFAWWAGLKVSDAKSGLAQVSSQLEQVSVDGTIYWQAGRLAGWQAGRLAGWQAGRQAGRLAGRLGRPSRRRTSTPAARSTCCRVSTSTCWATRSAAQRSIPTWPAGSSPAATACSCRPS